MHLFHMGGEVPEVPLPRSYPPETLLTGAVITSVLQGRETKAPVRGLALSPTSQLLRVIALRSPPTLAPWKL